MFGKWPVKEMLPPVIELGTQIPSPTPRMPTCLPEGSCWGATVQVDSLSRKITPFVCSSIGAFSLVMVTQDRRVLSGQ